MDLSKSTPSPEPQARDASIESSTTRPNPFNETESAARKRRRMSDLPSKTTKISNGDDHSDSSGSATVDADVAEKHVNKDSDGAMSVDPDPAMPQTPEGEGQRAAATPQTEPSASKCTINLRNAHSADGHNTPTSSQEHLQLVTMANEDVVTADAVDLVEVPDQSRRASPSSSGSPRVELIAISDDEDLPVNPSVLAGGLDAFENSILSDPLDRFPFQNHEVDEAAHETVQRIVDHLANRTYL